jgi:hypothetical protein
VSCVHVNAVGSLTAFLVDQVAVVNGPTPTYNQERC